MNNMKIIYLGIATGLILLVFGVILFLMNIDIWRLSFCTGFGIILAAFGTTANVKYKGITIAGSGAVAVILFLLLAKFGSDERITHVFINGNFTSETQIIVEDNYELLGAFRGKRSKNYEFIIEGTKLFKSFLTFYINDDIKEVSKKHIEPYLGKGLVIEWKYDYETGVLKDKNTGEIISESEIALSKENNNQSEHISLIDFDFFITSTYAQEEGLTYEELFNGLLSNNLRVRLESRTELSNRGLSAIGPMMAKFNQDPEIFRIKLGIVYSLSRIYIQQPDSVDRIKSKLTEQDIELLIKAANDKDKTVRIYSTKFLFGIADHRALEYSLRAIENTTNANVEGKYNSVLIIKSFFDDLPEEEKTRISNRLKSISCDLGPKAKDLIDSFISNP